MSEVMKEAARLGLGLAILIGIPAAIVGLSWWIGGLDGEKDKNEGDRLGEGFALLFLITMVVGFAYGIGQRIIK